MANFEFLVVAKVELPSNPKNLLQRLFEILRMVLLIQLNEDDECIL